MTPERLVTPRRFCRRWPPTDWPEPVASAPLVASQRQPPTFSLFFASFSSVIVSAPSSCLTCSTLRQLPMVALSKYRPSPKKLDRTRSRSSITNWARTWFAVGRKEKGRITAQDWRNECWIVSEPVVTCFSWRHTKLLLVPLGKYRGLARRLPPALFFRSHLI